MSEDIKIGSRVEARLVGETVRGVVRKIYTNTDLLKLKLPSHVLKMVQKTGAVGIEMDGGGGNLRLLPMHILKLVPTS